MFVSEGGWFNETAPAAWEIMVYPVVPAGHACAEVWSAVMTARRLDSDRGEIVKSFIQSGPLAEKAANDTAAAWAAQASK